MTAFDGELVRIRKTQTDAVNKHARVMAEIASQEEIKGKAEAVLKVKYGCDSLEQAEALAAKLAEDIQTEVDTIQELLK